VTPQNDETVPMWVVQLRERLIVIECSLEDLRDTVERLAQSKSMAPPSPGRTALSHAPSAGIGAMVVALIEIARYFIDGAT